MFAAEGAQVVVADVNADDAKATTADLEAGGGEALAVAVDVADETSTLELAAAVEARFGRADILVNNAGIWGDLERHPLLSVPVDYWDKVLGVNLAQPAAVHEAIAPGDARQRLGPVVNISSMGAYMVAGVYGVSKLRPQPAHVRAWPASSAATGSPSTPSPGHDRQRGLAPPGPEAGLREARRGEPDQARRHRRGHLRHDPLPHGDDAGWVTGQTFLVNGGFNTRIS